MTRGDRLRKEIAARGFAHAVVTGTSMLPTLRPEELVRIEACPDPQTGQVLAFEHGGGLLVHRVLRAGPHHVVCRGDNRLLDDGDTPRTAIVGCAVEVFGPERPGGVRLRDDAAALRRVDARLALRRLFAQASHARAEVALLAQQARGRQVFGRVTTVELAGLDGLDRSWWPVPRPSAALCDAVPGLAAAAASGESLTIPAALYSTLPSPDRVALVQVCLRARPSGGITTIHALAAAREHRLARCGAALRHCLGRLGVRAGEPGDTTWSTGDEAGHVPVHLFSAGELQRGLERAGARVLEVQPGTERSTKVWRATIGA